MAAALSEYDVAVAATAEPADLGCIRGIDLRHRIVHFLVHGSDSGFRHDAGQGRQPNRAKNIRRAGDGLAQFRQALGSISESISAAGRPFDAAGGFGALGGELRLRRCHPAGLAHHHLPALLRRGRYLFGLRHGVDAGDSGAPLVSPRGFDHHAPHRVHVEGDAGNRSDRRLRLCDGSFHGLVQRRISIERYAFVNRMWAGGYWWTYWVLILCNIMIPQLLWSRTRAHERPGGVRDRAGRERRDVAGAFRDRRHQPDSRFCAVVLGHVLSDRLGLEHVPGNDRRVSGPDVPVHSRPARHFDFRNARGGA